MTNKKNKMEVSESDKEKQLSSQMEKQLSPIRSLFRIIIAIFAFAWFLAGGSAQTVLSLSGGAMGLTGLVSFLIRNPLSFLIIGIIQVVLGLIFYLISYSFALLTIFHFLWSIRWFYGYKKYSHLKS